MIRAEALMYGMGERLMNENDRINDLLTNEIGNLWILMNHTTYAIGRQREMELAQLGITNEKHAILRVLTIKDGQNITDIAAVRLRQHHSIFTLINRMEKQGLVKKTKSPKSKEYRIMITDKGKEMYQKVTRKSLEATFCALSADDQQKLSQYLKLLLIRSLSLQGFDYKLPFLL
jgi:DNA-binding MarR family transcriptional regulator